MRNGGEGVDFGRRQCFSTMKSHCSVIDPLFVSHLSLAEELATARKARDDQGGGRRANTVG